MCRVVLCCTFSSFILSHKRFGSILKWKQHWLRGYANTAYFVLWNVSIAQPFMDMIWCNRDHRFHNCIACTNAKKKMQRSALDEHLLVRWWFNMVLYLFVFRWRTTKNTVPKHKETYSLRIDMWRFSFDRLLIFICVAWVAIMHLNPISKIVKIFAENAHKMRSGVLSMWNCDIKVRSGGLTTRIRFFFLYWQIFADIETKK